MNWSGKKIGISLVVFGLLVAVAEAKLPERMRVEVKEGQLRKSPSFLGQIVARLPFGTSIGVLNEQGAWVEVRAGQDQGWLHTSALNSGRAGLTSGGEVGSSATSDEVALAGKGFDQTVENTFRQQNPKLDFAMIDRMESYQVTSEEIHHFLSQGELPVAAGGGE